MLEHYLVWLLGPQLFQEALFMFIGFCVLLFVLFIYVGVFFIAHKAT